MRYLPLISTVALGVMLATPAIAGVDTTIDDFFLAGSQPGESGILEGSNRCGNCHAGYDRAVEPYTTWMGSMMAQAARDPLFKACLAIANQDAPDSGDLCIRCHSPKGWLEGRSIPTDMSALTGEDFEGLTCDFCHKMVKPSPVGTNPYVDDTIYTDGTYPADQAYLESIPNIPPHSGNGMYVVDSGKEKRGPFWDAEARHQMLYSPFHQDANFCGTCHDVSNPAFERHPGDIYLPNALGQPAPLQDKYTMFPVERTFSEWLNSDYNSPNGVYAPQFGGNKDYVATCQDCHMPDATALGCNKKHAPVRDDMPIHDLTGGNTFVPNLIPQLFPGETDEQALAEGVARARAMLQKAATMEVAVDSTSGLAVDVRVINETGHKLPSGYPEGRRMWLNVIGRDSSGAINYQSAAYDAATATLDTSGDAKVYEIHLGMSSEVAALAGLDPGKSFHFVLNNYVVFDNRIPPRGFTNEAFVNIQSPPVGEGVSYADYEYWDDTRYTLPVGTVQIEVNLYYQTVSKEYIEFLRDENGTNTDGQTMYDLWANNGMSAPELMATQTVILGQIEDNEPPSPPTDLVAAAVSSRAIDLAWTASVDNIGVTGYEVFRDGTSVGTTTSTTFGDSGLASSTTYTYQVSAYDAAGNVSLFSAPASATTEKKGGGGGGGKPRGALAQSGTTVMLVPDVNPAPAEGTGLSFYLPEASHVRLRVVDVAGRKVAEISNENLPAGHHQAYFDARGVSAGMYFAVLETDTGREVAKISIVR